MAYLSQVIEQYRYYINELCHTQNKPTLLFEFWHAFPRIWNNDNAIANSTLITRDLFIGYTIPKKLRLITPVASL